MELGSEYNLSLSQLTIRDNNIFNYLAKYAFLFFFDSGRSALKHIASNLDSEDEILMPEFICDSVIDCFWNESIKYYRLNYDFTINLESLESIITKKTRVIFIMHYFGGLQSHDTLMQIDSIAKENNIIIIEDTTHSIFTKSDTIGDYQVCSIRKWMPIPSGGVLYSNNDKLKAFSSIQYDICSDNTRAYGMILKDMFLNQKLDCNTAYRRVFAECEKQLDMQKEIYKMSDFAHFIASCIDVSDIYKSRRDNYVLLRKGLIKKGLYPVVKLDKIDCPFVLPIRIRKRNTFRSYLIDHNIYCAVHWPFNASKTTRRPFAYDCAQELISLPIDQRYGEADINYMLDVIYKYGEK